MSYEMETLADGPFRPRCYRVVDEPGGLVAYVVIDDTSLGPAAGGIRTRAYADEDAALADARKLARSMTFKCALAGLSAGGGKGVVMLRPGLARARAFEALGDFVADLGGEFLTAGDMGTTASDLATMATRTAHVYTDEAGLTDAVGRGCVRAMQAARSLATDGAAGTPAEDGGLSGARVAVQGCGMVGAAVARAAREAGAEIIVADLESARARDLAEELGAAVVSADRILEEPADILAPCAVGGVISVAVAERLRARAVCGAANNILAVAGAEDTMRRREIIYVPSALASAGAVIEGVGKTLMSLPDCGELIDRVFTTTRRVLLDARAGGQRAGEVAERLALARIDDARAASAGSM